MSRTVVINGAPRQTVVTNKTPRGTVLVYGGPGVGPPGPSGSAAFYMHDQTTPSTVWTINHNLGFKPVVEVFTPGGLMMLAEIQHTSITQTLITFNTPTAGFARLI
jgi:hypothetical protein